jgi:hypothetical protein
MCLLRGTNRVFELKKQCVYCAVRTEPSSLRSNVFTARYEPSLRAQFSFTLSLQCKLQLELSYYHECGNVKLVKKIT